MALPPDIAGKLNNPAPVILSYLESLNGQLSVGTADTTGDSEVVTELFGTVIGSRKNYKPFLVGLIPPDGRLNFVPFKSVETRLASIAAQTGVVAPAAGAGAGQLGPNFWINFVAMCQRLNLDPKELAKVFNTESGFKPGAQNVQNGRVVAKGIPQFVKSTAISCGGMTPEQWNTFQDLSGEDQLPFIENYLNKTGIKNGKKAGTIYGSHFGGYNLPGFGRGYMSRSKFASLSASQQEAIRKAVGKNLEFMFKAYDQNPAVDTNNDGVAGSADLAGRMDKTPLQLSIAQNIEAAQAGIRAGARATPPGQAEAQALSNAEPPPGGSIMGFGDTTEAELDPAGDRIGRTVIVDGDRLEVAARQVEALRQQIETIRRTPALLMLVNPSEFRRAYENSVDAGTKGRYGNIVHTWLERPFSISASGVTAGQYVISSEGEGGLSSELRVYSASYENLLSLILTYKANGVLYAGEESDRGIPLLCYSVFIYYDNHIYIGSFDSFEVPDSATKPYNMAYSFKFTVRYDLPVGNDGRLTDFETGVVSDQLISAPGFS